MEIKSERKSIKEMLEAGADPKQMLADMQNQILAAQKEIQEEEDKKAARAIEQKNASVRVARQKVVYAMRDYMAAIGIVEDKEDGEEFMELINQAFSEMEKQFMGLAELLKTAKKIKDDPECEKKRNTEDVNVDAILKSFLKTL